MSTERGAEADETVAAMTALILEVFRVNGRLLAAGDRLVAPLGLTSARWQVLGAVAIGGAPQPVAWIARQMGLRRQGVQRLVNEMAADGFLAFRPNPHHRRAKLVALTEQGRAALSGTEALQAPWAARLAGGLDPAAIEGATALLHALRLRLEAASPGEDGDAA